MATTALIILTEGFEEIEAITPIDLLRRANISVTIASQSNSLLVKGRNDIPVQAAITLESALDSAYDIIILPGGPGSKNLRNDPSIIKAIKKQAANNKAIAAICAAPTVLLQADLLNDIPYTAHFSTQDELPHIQKEKPVVTAGNIITSQGAGTAIPFSLAIIEKLLDSETANKIKNDICA